jgi:hypothetical protein
MIEPGPREILPRGMRLPWFVFGADEAALPAMGADGVAQGGGEIQRVDTPKDVPISMMLHACIARQS